MFSLVILDYSLMVVPIAVSELLNYTSFPHFTMCDCLLFVKKIWGKMACQYVYKL